MENHFALLRCFGSYVEVQKAKQELAESTFQMIYMIDSKKTETAAKLTGKSYNPELK